MFSTRAKPNSDQLSDQYGTELMMSMFLCFHTLPCDRNTIAAGKLFVLDVDDDAQPENASTEGADSCHAAA